MTNPNPVAPKTDTPATEDREPMGAPICTECKRPVNGHPINRFGVALCIIGEETLEELPSNQERFMQLYDEWNGLGVLERFITDKLIAVESTLAAERASRLQAEEAIPLKIGAQVIVKNRPEIISQIVRVIECYELSGGSVFNRNELALAKPTVSPEQAEETK